MITLYDPEPLRTKVETAIPTSIAGHYPKGGGRFTVLILGDEAGSGLARFILFNWLNDHYLSGELLFMRPDTPVVHQVWRVGGKRYSSKLRTDQ